MSVFLPSTEQNLILTGYIGPDTAMLAQAMAAQLRMTFVNVDTIIVNRLEMPVDEIRDRFGEMRLKAIEAEVLQETALRRQNVIYISGRILAIPAHLERMKATGPVLCLTIDLNAMLRRMHVSMGAKFHNPQERAIALGVLKREWKVHGSPGLHNVDTTYVERDEVIKRVATLWQELAIERA